MNDFVVLMPQYVALRHVPAPSVQQLRWNSSMIFQVEIRTDILQAAANSSCADVPTPKASEAEYEYRLRSVVSCKLHSSFGS